MRTNVTVKTLRTGVKVMTLYNKQSNTKVIRVVDKPLDYRPVNYPEI